MKRALVPGAGGEVCFRRVLGAPLVERRRRPDATHATLVTAGFLRIEMLPKILQGVRGQPLSKCRAGLRAPPHHSELIDVAVPCPRSTTEWSFAILDQALSVAVRFLSHSVSKPLGEPRVDGESLGGQPHVAVFSVKDQ